MDVLQNNGRLTLIAGPCAMEGFDVCAEVARTLKAICEQLDIDYYFKCSVDKANRTAANNYRGLGIEKGLEILAQIKEEIGVCIVTDIHEPNQAKSIAEVADIIQIPAFLCRQTDLLGAVAKTGKIINVKKAQFMSPEEMGKVARKLKEFGNERILICERGTAFGYHDLIVDMTGLPRLKKYGYPVVFDATHSVQISGVGNSVSNSGASEFVPTLAKAALATGAVDALFMEIHPKPLEALCDGSCMLKLSGAEKLLEKLVAIFKLCKEG